MVLFWKLFHSEKGVGVAIPPSPMDSRSELACWVLGWLAGASVEEKEATIHAIYGLWLARNDARDGRKMKQPHEILASVLCHLAEWKGAHSPSSQTPVQRVV